MGQTDVAAAVSPDGRFVAAWVSHGGPIPPDVYSRRFKSDGPAESTEENVNMYNKGCQESVAVGVWPDGRHVIAWRGHSCKMLFDANAGGILVQRFNWDGSRLYR